MAVEERMEYNVFGRPEYFLSDPAVRKIEYSVYQPSNDYALWSVKPMTGPVPPELQGMYTNHQDAIAVVKRFLQVKGKDAKVQPEA